jgi:predicted PurR-regulated permease PerM
LRIGLGLAALVALLVGVGAVLAPFAKPIVWSLILVSATWPAHRWIRERVGQRRNLAALLATLGLILVVLLPATGLSVALVHELEPLLDLLRDWATGKVTPDVPDAVDNVPIFGEQIRGLIEESGQPEARREWVRAAAGQVREIVAVGRNVLMNLVGLFLALFTAFFVYRDGEEMLTDVLRLFERVAGRRSWEVTQAVRETVRAVFYGWLMTAAAQGLAAIVGYWIAGLRAPVLLGIASGFAAVIPFGVGLVWLPVVVLLAFKGMWWQALFLTVWFLGFVGLIDNFLRPLFISGPSRVPFILIFFGLLGGLAAFGLLGLVLGPVLLAVMLALWRQVGDLFEDRPAPGGSAP